MPITKIPDVVNHSALLGALSVIRTEVESRQEDVHNLAGWSGEMAARMEGIAEELQALNVDSITIGNILAVKDAVAGQAHAAVRYASLTDESVQQAETASRTARRNHQLIEEAVNDAPVTMADPAFYNVE